MLKKRLEPEVRKAQILDKALELATLSNYMVVTQTDIAVALDISHSLVLVYFSTMDELRKQIIQRAIDTRNHQVMIQALVNGNKLSHTVPDDLYKQLQKGVI